MTGASELTTLVETEQRLDDAVASARQAADALREAARERARAATLGIERSIEVERERVSRAMAAEAVERERAIEQDATARIARYEGLPRDEIERLARVLARRVIEIALEES